MPTKRPLRPVAVPIVHMAGRILCDDGRTPAPERLQRLPLPTEPTRYLFDDADLLVTPSGGTSLLRRGFP